MAGKVAAVVKGVATDAGNAASNIAKSIAKVTTEAAEREEANLTRILDNEASTAKSFSDIHENPPPANAKPKTVAEKKQGKPGEWVAGLSDADRASFTRLQDAVDRAANRSADEIRDSLTARQRAAGQADPWLQGPFVGSDIEKTAAADSSVANDANIRHQGSAQPGQPVPDFVIGDGKNVDVTGASQSSIDKHLARDYYDHPDQIITYPSIPQSKLKDIFR